MKKPHVDKSFWPVLAGMRFLFALWVLFDHTYNFGTAERAMPVLTKSGFGAVFGFFVISGFSIHHSIVQRPEGYIKRRIWRIYPTNFVAVILAFLTFGILGLAGQYAVPPTPPHWWQWLCDLLLLQGIFPAEISILHPNWSIALEALYYCCALFLVKINIRFTLLIVALSYVLHLLGYLFMGYIIKPTVSLGFAYGVCAFTVSWIWLAGWIAYSYPRNKIFAALFAAAGCLYMWWYPLYFSIDNFTSAAANYGAWLATIAIVFFQLNFKRRPWVDTLLIYLGDISFPLYLLHYPVMYLLTSTIFKRHPQWNYGIIEVAISLMVAALVLKFVDRPLRDRHSFRSQKLLPKTEILPA